MKIIFSKYAKLELEDAVHFYELEFEGLGWRFKEEIKTKAIRISEYPKAWSVERGEVRRCLLHKFPYKLLYSIENQIIGLVESNHNKAILPSPKSGAANLNEVHNSQPVSSSCLKIHKNVLSVRVGF